MPKALLSLVPLFACTAILTGCGSQFSTLPTLPSLTPGIASVGAIQGNIHGGQPPISGSRVYLYESVSTGYGKASHSLLSASGTNTVSDGTNYYVVTDNGGGFALTGDYTCTSGSQVYALVLGGNAGGGVNASIGLMATLGQCPSSGSLAAQVPFLYVNEVSTVATAYALAGFMSTPTQLSIANTALAKTGLANAAANVTNIVGQATGVAGTTTLAPGSNGTVPQARINTLANILASCVNTAGPPALGCVFLFNNATSDGTSSGTAPTNTAQAILNIAHHPASNVSTLFALNSATAAFQPSLATAPNDFLLPITYPNTAANIGNALAIDSDGNAWVAGASKLGKITPLGTASAVSGITGSSSSSGHGLYGVAVSPTGLIWASDYTKHPLYMYDGSSVTTTSGPTTYYPEGIAFDASGKAYIANDIGYGTDILQIYSSAGAFQSSLTANVSNVAYPTTVALDSGNNAWLNSGGFGYVGKVPPGATTGSATASAYPVTGVGANNPIASLAIDSNDAVWIDSGSVNTLFKMSNAGSVTASYTGAGLNQPATLAIDGAGNIWVTNTGTTNVSEFANAGTALSPSSGYSTGAGAHSSSVAIDGSGNVWLGTTDATAPVTQLLGAATPVATPILPYQNGVRP